MAINVKVKNGNHGSQTALPVYDSMAQCSAATGIPLALLKLAKRSGCDGFRSNRVALGPVLRWAFGRDAEADEDWPGRLKRAQTLRQEHALSLEQGKVLDKAEVSAATKRCVSVLLSTLDRIATIEAPPALKGLDEAGIQRYLLDAIGRVKSQARESISTLTDKDVA